MERRGKAERENGERKGERRERIEGEWRRKRPKNRERRGDNGGVCRDRPMAGIGMGMGSGTELGSKMRMGMGMG